MNDILKSIYERKSVRVFEDKLVSDNLKEELINATLQAPSAGNQLLYSIIDVSDPLLKEKLAKSCDNQQFISTAPLVFVFVADHTRWHQSFKLANANPRQLGVGDLFLAMSDTAIAAQNMVVVAESLGLGSCYIGDILEHYEIHKELLNLPNHCVPVCMLVLGYPSEQQKQRIKPARFDAKYIVGENTYPYLNKQQLVDCYNERENKSNNINHLSFEEWMKRFCKRKFNSEFSEEMTRSVTCYLKEYGFVKEPE